MNYELLVVGLSHKDTPVEIREKLSFSREGLTSALKELKGCPHIKECVILSTCNRVEVYAAVADTHGGINSIKDFLANYHCLDGVRLDDYLSTKSSKDAIRHLMRVASGLESMVVGEDQILTQVRDAYKEALAGKTTGLLLNTLFQRALNVAKRARTQTGIGEGAASVSSAAVELARHIFCDLKDKTVMIIGAGQMSELALKCLVESGVSAVIVSNRTYEKAEELAKRFNGQAVNFDDIFKVMLKADIVISSTDAPHFIIRPDAVERVIRLRRHKPIFFIDIAVPRDIDPAINRIDGVYLYDIDDLEIVVKANIKKRTSQVHRAEKIIEEELTNILSWHNCLEVVPTIRSLKERLETIRKGELNKTIRKLKGIRENDREKIDYLTQAIVNKIAALPIDLLKKHAQAGDGYLYAEALQELFDLEGEK